MKTINMDIYSPPGTKIIFDRPDAGWPGDQALCKKYLKLGQTYTIEQTLVYSSRTEVYLEEVPTVPFNSVNFGIEIKEEE